jgi:FkbM family methyltransferase
MRISVFENALAVARRSTLLRHATAWLLQQDRDRKLELFGAPLVANPRWELGYIYAERQQRYSNTLKNDLPILISLALILEPTDTFLDIGANVGLYSSVLGRIKCLFPQLAFHAFEVNPNTAQRLRASVAGIGVEVHSHGLSDCNDEIPFSAGITSGLFCASDAAQDGNAAMLPVRRLDDCSIEGQSLVMKIDVEGHEYEVLSGASATFEACRVKAVCIDGYSDRRVEDFLRTHGFCLHDARTLQPLSAPDAGAPLLALRPGSVPGGWTAVW